MQNMRSDIYCRYLTECEDTCQLWCVLQVTSQLSLLSCMKKDSPPPHRGGEIVRGLPCIKKLNQGGVKLGFVMTVAGHISYFNKIFHPPSSFTSGL